MDYLINVWHLLKTTTWERPVNMIRDTATVLGVMIGMAILYWLLDTGMQLIISHM